jgi:hypothetical protein
MYAWIPGGVGGWGSRNVQELAPVKGTTLETMQSEASFFDGEVNGLPTLSGGIPYNVNQTLFMPHLLWPLDS